jgi:probable HAF family extracellular repeat protein
LVTVALAVLLALGLTAVPAAGRTGPLTCRGVYTDLGVLGGLDSHAWGVSRRGVVVGHADTSPGSGWHGFHAFRWTPRAAMVDLGTLPGDVSSAAAGISSAGTIVGVSMSADASTRPFVFRDRMRFLGSLGGGTGTAAAINEAGRIVGTSRTRTGANHAYLWVPVARSATRGSMVDLGVPRGRIATDATAISGRGLVVGGALDADFYGRAFLWTPSRPNGTKGRMVLLPLLPGGSFNGATGVNDRGQVVGNADDREGADRAFLYERGRVRALPLLAGGTHGFAFGISGNGVVVGYADDSAGDRAVAWVGGQVVDLNGCLPASVRRTGAVLRVAQAINDHGQVVGWAQAADGHAHAYLLTVHVP